LRTLHISVSRMSARPSRLTLKADGDLEATEAGGH
jgi:hypothetical protein